jgi:hypothetical protein
MKKILALSILSVGLIAGPLFNSSGKVVLEKNPIKSEYRSAESGGNTPAIVTYRDGVGAFVTAFESDNSVDNSALNKLVFKYGTKAEEAGVTIYDQILYGNENPSEEDIKLAQKLETEADIIAQNDGPKDGDACDDLNALTSNDVYVDGVCKGTYPTNMYFVSNTGNNANTGQEDSPYIDMQNIPSGATVVLKNGTYTGMSYIDGYHSAASVLYGLQGKSGITIMGESISGVVIQVKDTGSRDESLIPSTANGVKLVNLTVNHYLPLNRNYSTAISRFSINPEYHNVVFNISGYYSLNYHNGGTVDHRVSYNNCTFNGGTLLPNYTGYHIINETSPY